MRKTSILFLLIIVLTSLIGCKSDSDRIEPCEYESMVMDIPNNGILTPFDFNPWGEQRFERENVDKVSCTVQGTKYKGVYKYSEIVNRTSYTTDFYEDENGVRYGVDSKTKDLVYIYFVTKGYYDSEILADELDDPFGTANRLARDIAKQYLGDLDEYEELVEDLKVEKHTKDGEEYEIDIYSFSYCKKIGGYLSSDSITVQVTEKGNLVSIYIGDIGVFDKLSLEINRNEVNDNITKKIDSVYVNTGEVINYTVNKQQVVMTPSKEVGIISWVDVLLKIDGKETPTSVTLLTIIAKSK